MSAEPIGIVALAMAKSSSSSIAEEYKPSKTYTNGALAIKDGKLQKYVDGSWVDAVLADSIGGGDIIQSGEEHVGIVVGGTTASIDPTLSIAGEAADSKAVGDAIAALEAKFYKGNKTFLEIRDAVRNGTAPTLYPVGTVITVPHEQYPSGVDFMVADHEYNGKPGMVLVMKDVIYGRAFDARQAVLYAKNGLTAGAYKFTVKNQVWYTADNDVTYYFTLAHNLPAGGQGVLSMTYNASLEGKTIKTYANAYSTTEIDTATLSATEIADAVDLGQTDGAGEYLNHMHRAVFGSNNYAQSSLREWINSASGANAWWMPTTRFSRPTSYNDVSGFLGGFGDNFAEALAEVDVPCRTNNTYETEGYTTNKAYTVKDRMFLLSRDELGYGVEGIACGGVLDFYADAEDVDRIKYDIADKATARYWWLRSPYLSRASSVRYVEAAGNLGFYYAVGSYGACAACVIA